MAFKRSRVRWARALAVRDSMFVPQRTRLRPRACRAGTDGDRRRRGRESAPPARAGPARRCPRAAYYSARAPRHARPRRGVSPALEGSLVAPGTRAGRRIPLTLAAAPHCPAGPRRGTARRCRRAPTISRAARPALGGGPALVSPPRGQRRSPLGWRPAGARSVTRCIRWAPRESARADRGWKDGSGPPRPSGQDRSRERLPGGGRRASACARRWSSWEFR